MKTILFPCAVLMLALAGNAAAQDSSTQDNGQSAMPCKAQPQDNGQKSGDDSSADSGAGSTSKLGPCGGVLQPPPTGDQEITQPPPDQGKTPVIKPGDVPVQPPKQ